MNEPKDHYRGTFLPVSLVRLYESGALNGDEILLLSKIDALQDPKRGGCWASNQYLGAWWRKTDNWVSKTISKFHTLRLIKVKQLGDGMRLIQMDQIGENSKLQVELNSKLQIGENSNKGSLRKEERGKASAGADRPPVHALLPPEDSRPMEFSPAVKRFHDWSRKREFHILSRNGVIKFAKGGHKGGWTRPVLERWERIWKELCGRYGEDRVAPVLDFFLKNYDNEWCPEAKTLGTFADRFDKAEKFMKRQRMILARTNGEAAGSDGEPVWEPATDEGRRLLDTFNEK